jgi:S1-C subfamily serine protease
VHTHSTDATFVLVHLSGTRRGTTEPLEGELAHIGSAADADIQVRLAGTTPSPAHYAVLRRRGGSFEVQAAAGQELWVNGEQVDQLVLASGDVLEFGREGPVLRFRRYPPGRGSFKTPGEAFSDCLECARHEPGGLVRKTAVFLGAMPGELATQTSRTFRLSVAGTLLLLVVGLVSLTTRTVRVERTLSREALQVRGLAGLLDNQRADTASEAGARAALAELQATVAAAQGRIALLEARNTAAAHAIAAATQSTVFLQGGYGFVEPHSGLGMRLALGVGGAPMRSADGAPLVTTEGDGPLVEIYYSGSGFVAAEDGLILTNRHVALPWESDESAMAVIAQGWRPVMRQFVGYLPGLKKPFAVTFVSRADSVDLALVRGNGAARSVAPLHLRAELPAAGEEVYVLGYPLGIRALLARARSSTLDAVKRSVGGADLWSAAARLASTGEITPLATRGIVGQSSPRGLIYDAETTHGGSGGPVLGVGGDVVAINAAIVPEFGGSNLGVPARDAIVLLNRARRK